jgi:hypothetical protein
MSGSPMSITQMLFEVVAMEAFAVERCLAHEKIKVVKHRGDPSISPGPLLTAKVAHRGLSSKTCPLERLPYGPPSGNRHRSIMLLATIRKIPPRCPLTRRRVSASRMGWLAPRSSDSNRRSSKELTARAVVVRATIWLMEDPHNGSQCLVAGAEALDAGVGRCRIRRRRRCRGARYRS